MVLSDKAQSATLLVIDSFDAATGKTKEMATLLKKFPLARRCVLIATGKKNAALTRAAQNIQGANTVLADSLNTVDV